MSTEHDIDNAEFDAFLRGEDDLSRGLKSLTHPSPSAELDRSVLAAIESALAEENGSKRNAANDEPEPSRGKRGAPQFIFNRYTAIGMAAGVLLAVIVQWQMNAGRSVPMMAAAEKAAHSDMQKKTAPSTQKKPAELPLIAKADLPAASMPKAAGRGMTVSPPAPAPARILAPPVIAPAEVAPIEVARTPAALQQSLNQRTRAPEHADVIAAEDVGKMPDKNVADSLQRISRITMTTPVAPTAPFVPPARAPDANASNAGKATASMPAPEEAQPAAENTIAATSAMPAAARLSSVAAEPFVNYRENPKAWLDLVQKKLDARLEQEALDEWDRFRKAYPDYVVPDDLTEKIGAVQKSQK